MGYKIDSSERAYNKKRESMRDSVRSGSVSSGTISPISSTSLRTPSSNKAPKVLAVVIATMVVVALVTGITFYLLEIEKQELADADSVVYFSEGYTSSEANQRSLDSSTEPQLALKSEDGQLLDLTDGQLAAAGGLKEARKSIVDFINRQKLIELAKLKLLEIREEESENPELLDQVDQFLRPIKAANQFTAAIQPTTEQQPDNLLLQQQQQQQQFPQQQQGFGRRHQGMRRGPGAARAVNHRPGGPGAFGGPGGYNYLPAAMVNDMTNPNHAFKSRDEDLEFGGPVGLFGTKSSETEVMPSLNNHKIRNQYDMSFYRNPEDVGILSHGGPGHAAGPFNGQPPFLEPARGQAQAQGILRPGLEGIHRGVNEMGPLANIENTEATDYNNMGGDYTTDYYADYNTGDREDREDGLHLSPEMNKNVLAQDGSIRPMVDQTNMGADSTLNTIDRRPGRPTFHHQGPMSHAESPNGSPAAAAATEDETEAVTAVDGTEQTAVDSTDQAQPVNEVQKSLAQLLGPQQLKQLRQGLLSGRISREQLFTIRQAMLFQNQKNKAATTTAGTSTASSTTSTSTTSTSTTTSQSTTTPDMTSERQKEGLLLPGLTSGLNRDQLDEVQRQLDKHLAIERTGNSGKLQNKQQQQMYANPERPTAVHHQRVVHHQQLTPVQLPGGAEQLSPSPSVMAPKRGQVLPFNQPQVGQGAINMNKQQQPIGGPVVGAGVAPSGGRYGPYGGRLGFQGRQDVAERRRQQPRRRFRGQPTAAKYSQEPEELRASYKQNDVDHEAILDNFDAFIKLAGTELLQLKDVAKNISASKGEVNLWQIISSVNSTVRQNPTSNMAKLMKKFEERYMSEDPGLEDGHPADAVYERSLSSLLFLSMGIFLLNSVNDLVDSGASANIAAAAAEDDLEQNNSIHPASAVNNYLKLVMNLMNAYVQDSDEFECIYASYCEKLNNQAQLGGLASSVARINSVGMRLAMDQLSPFNTFTALVKTLMGWENLPCKDIFNHCGTTKDRK